MSDETTLLPCPWCGGEAEICHVRDICRDPQDWYWGKCLSCHISGKHYPTEAEAIAAWNTRADYHGYEQAAIEAWESIKKWNSRAHGTLTAEQVMSIAAKHQPEYCSDTHVCFDWQAIADELNANLGSETCYIVKTPSDSDFSDDWRYRCSECGCNIPVNERDPETGDVINAANYCPHCGKAVKR